MTTLGDFHATTLDGQDRDLGDYLGDVVLVVNTASKCGFTPQYEGLQDLHRQYNWRGLELLAFPCNQFGSQEPGSSSEIAHFCQRNYSVSFRMFEKIDVNGSDAHPLYRWLTGAKRGVLGTRWIKWNFTKFLIDRSGTPVRRYGTWIEPVKIAPGIEKLLT